MPSKNQNKTGYRSIAGGKPLSYWLRFYGLALLTTLSAAAAIIPLLQVYIQPSTPADFQRIIIPLVILVVLAIPLIITIIRLSIDYRRRYRIVRDNSMVRDLYPNRLRLQENYGKVIMNAEQKIMIIGTSLRTLVTSLEFESWITTALIGKEELHIHIFLPEPNTEIIKQKEKEERKSEGTISHDIIVSMNKVINIKNEHWDKIGNRFHIHIVKNVFPVAFMLLLDNTELYLEPYLSYETGRSWPTFVIRKNKNNEMAFLGFKSYSDRILLNSEEILKEKITRLNRNIHTAFGEDKCRGSIKKTIFLDRDGVIVEDTGYISNPEQLKLLPGILPVLRKLQNSFRLVVVTNQSGIARGYFTEKDFHDINDRFIQILDDHGVSLDAIYYCPHHPEVGLKEYRIECDCRKPKTGLLRLATEEFGIELGKSFLIGDKDTDIQAGRAFGVRTIKINPCDNSVADFVIKNFTEVLNIIG